MSQPVLQFWQLVAQSGLLTRAECNAQAIAFVEAHGGRQPEQAAELAAFLIQRAAITPYQAQVLAAGAAGPFDYGDYRVTDRVTAGPLKGLFRAVHRASGHPVGLWFLPAKATPDEIAQAQAAVAFHSQIRSPHLSECYELVDLGNVRFVVLENIAGEPLASAIKSKPAAGQACRLTRELAEALLPLHERGAPHANVSPANILLDERGAARLLSYPLCAVPAGPSESGPSPAEDTKALGRLLLSFVDGTSPKTRDELAARLNAAARPESGIPPGVAKCLARMLGADDKKLRHAAEVVVALAPFADLQEEAAPPATKANFERALRGETILPASKPFAPAAALPANKPAPAAPAAAKPQPVVMPKIAVDAEPTLPGQRRRSSSKLPLILGGIGVAVVLGGILLWASGMFDGSDETAANTPDNTSPAGTGSAAANGDGSNGDDALTPVAGGAEPNVVPTRREFWVSPTHGEPIDLRYQPIGAQAYLYWRPAEWMERPQAAAMLADIAPAATSAEAVLKRHCGLAPADVESITLSFFGGETAELPRTAAVIRTKEPVSADSLKQAFPDLDSAQLEGKEVYFSGELGFYLPAGDDHLIVSAALQPLRKLNETESLLQLALANETSPPLLNREITLLQRTSDSDRLLTVIFVPNFPFTDFKALWSGPTAEFNKPFREFFATNARSCAVSAHFVDDDLFLELRVVGDPEITPMSLANMYQDRVANFPRQLEDLLVNVYVSDYSKPILTRFPRMLNTLSEQVEGASARDQAVLRCYLPEVAAVNLAFAAQLAMIESSGAGPIIPRGAGAQPQTFANVTELLAGKKITLEIARDTLEETINKFAMEAGATVKIDGGALLLEGIAKNKTLGTSEQDKPAGAVLRAILNTADSRLVYVIRQENDEDVVYVTTRASAEKQGETIPPEFSTGSGGESQEQDKRP